MSLETGGQKPREMSLFTATLFSLSQEPLSWALGTRSLIAGLPSPGSLWGNVGKVVWVGRASLWFGYQGDCEDKIKSLSCHGGGPGSWAAIMLQRGLPTWAAT